MPREMKDSGIEWIGEIPNTWATDRLQWHLEEVKVSNSPIQSEQILSLTIEAGVIPYEEKGNQGNKSKENYEEYKLAYPNTLVVNSMNVIIGAVGISKYFGCVSPVYYVFRATPNTDLRYIYYLFTNVGFQKEMRKYAKGILEIRLRISAEDMLKRIIPKPSYKEQKAIADFLDRRCAEIDAVIEQTKATIEEYKKLKQALIMEATSIGIKSNRELKASGLEWITQIPKEWKVTRAKHILRKLERPMLPTDEVVICSNSGKAFYRGDKSTGLVSLTDNGYQGVEAGDLMIHGMDTWHGAIAISNIRGKCTSVVHVCDSTENKQYIAYYLQALAFRNVYKAITNGVRQNTSDYRSWDKAGSIQIVLPPYDEQCEIAEYLDKKCAEIDTLIEKKTALLAEMETYKKSLIFEHVTGKKEVV